MEKELKNKISKAMEEDFVGNYIFTNGELTSIYNDASFVLRSIGDERGVNLSFTDFELVFVAIVNLAKEWKGDEEAFFDFISRKLLGSKSIVGKIYNQIVRVIKSLNASRKIFMLDCYKKKYYATLCSHSFAPLSSIESFFDMCWEIYCKDLDQQCEPNDPVFKLIANSLNRKFLSSRNDEEDFKIGSNVYSLRVGIRGLAIDHIDLMISLLQETMCSIHSLFNNEPLKKEKYLADLIKLWWKKKELNFGIEYRKIYTNSEYICTDYSKIKAKYIFEDGKAKIVIPSIRLIDNYDFEPYIEIKIDGKRVECIRMRTHGSGILMATKRIEYDLESFEFESILDINIEITHCDKVIYNSKDTLKREFILFKDSKEVLSLECIPGIYFLFTKNLENLLRYPEDIHKIELNTYSLETFDGEMIQSNNKTVFFLSEKNNRDLYFLAKERVDMIYRYIGGEYKVIDGELYIEVDENIDVKDVGVRYESIIFKLLDFDSEVISGKKRYAISTLLNVGETQHISVFRYSNNKVLASINLIKFNNIRVSFDKPLYYGKGITGTVRFITDKHDLKALFDIKKNEVSLPLGDGEIILYPPILKWKIDDGEWNTAENQKGMWYKQLTNSSIITFDIPKNMACNFVVLGFEYLKQSANGFSYKIGQTLYSIRENNEYTQNYSPLRVYIEAQSYGVSFIYYRECFTDEPLFVMGKSMEAFWLPETFRGDDNTRFRLDVYNQSNRCILTKELTLKKELLNFTDIAIGFYKYKIVMLGKGFLNIEKELYSKDFILGDIKDIMFLDKIIAIKKVYLFDKIEPVPVRPIYIDKIKYLGEKDNYDYYSGSLFILKEGRKIYLNSMKNEFNQYVKINPVRIERKNADSCYLGYGLDIYDEDFEYDDEFILDNEGKTTIGSITSKQRTRGIDYFLFEVKKNV